MESLRKRRYPVQQKPLMGVSAGIMPLDIELRLLRAFVHMHEAGSLSAAAVRMNCTQAAMSMRLKSLEAELGTPLFLRTPQGLRPTARGADLYARALGVMSAYDEMLSATRERRRRPRIRIGLPDDYAQGWLGPLLSDLGSRLDRVEIEVTCDLSANLLAMAERGEVDLALVTLAVPPARARANLALPLDWVGRSPVGGGVRLAAYPEGCVFRRAMTAALDAAGRPWRVAIQSRAHAAVFAPVRAGLAVTCAARGTAPADLAGLPPPQGLPELPPVALTLVASPEPRAAARPAEEALLGRLRSLVPA